MTKELYPYYERELRNFRKYAEEFAKQYPATAGRLLLETNRSADPHVERLIEAFALMAARVRHKLDDDFPELTDALLSVLYPHYLAPIPSLAIIQFELDSAGAQLPDGFLIDRGSRLHSQPVGELPCNFRTCYPVTLWPVAVTRAQFVGPPFPAALRPPPDTAAALRLQLECQADMQFGDLSLDRLRFYLHGDNHLVARLYEHILNRTTQVLMRSADNDTPANRSNLDPDDCLFPVGFGRNEGLLPYPNQSFMGYRLLTEFFAFPNKFLFFELGGLKKVCREGFGKRLDMIFFMNHYDETLEHSIDASAFRLGCTPVVNLFEQVAEPILLNQTSHEYPITPSIAHPRGMEVYSVDSVVSTDPSSETTTEFYPFYSTRHPREKSGTAPQAFWYASRRPSPITNDSGTDVYLNLVDLDFNPRQPSKSVLTVRTTCTNRDLPNQLQLAGEKLRFELEASAPLSRITCVRPATAPQRPPLRKGAHWRLVSHLALNHLSLTDPKEACDALKEILRLYDFSDAKSGAVVQQMIEGILSVSSRRIVGQIGSPTSSGFCRGIEVTIDLDEERFVSTGAFLFASVLERFFGLYASMNSFVQLVATSKQEQGVLKRWPPRAGDQQLL